MISGVGFAARKIGSVTSTHERIIKDGDSWTLNVTSTFRNTQSIFKLDEEFDEVTADGRKCVSTFSIKDGKLVKHQKGPGESIITRELVDDDTMILTMVPLHVQITIETSLRISNESLKRFGWKPVDKIIRDARPWQTDYNIAP
ncbi:unnamed protein product [Owenia fusiformis]|uniref:Lipocalin/cytosolic fatty-acid binding domain-containing protein n=1 Tax=Owenia fusiformis TaxID=6347 RepID=A0A8S4NKS9_OWEFU|nr:unnamed protein product [Owenia fusiformis]